MYKTTLVSCHGETEREVCGGTCWGVEWRAEWYEKGSVDVPDVLGRDVGDKWVGIKSLVETLTVLYMGGWENEGARVKLNRSLLNNKFCLFAHSLSPDTGVLSLLLLWPTSFQSFQNTLVLHSNFYTWPCPSLSPQLFFLFSFNSGGTQALLLEKHCTFLVGTMFSVRRLM